MNRIIINLIALLLLSPQLLSAQETTKPNIIVILADDLGFSDIGCYGGEIDTPHIDGLAKNGLRFTNFYNAARCCPTRAALLTGLYPHQAGIGHMVANGGTPSYQGYLNEYCVTLAEALKPSGYSNLTVGKWHVGSAPEHWPLNRGFDRFWGTPLGGGVYFKDTLLIRKEAIFVSGTQRIDPPDDMYVTDDFTDRAMDFIDEAVTKTKQPFFLYLAHIAPHWPLQAKPEDIKKYAGRYDRGWDRMREQRFSRQKELGIIPRNAKLSPRDPKAKEWDTLPEARRKELARRMEIYAAQVDSLDQNIGRLIEKLKQLDQFENTLIFFLSDNGCSPENGPGGFNRGLEGAPIGTGRSYASAGLEWANACNTPFRKHKADAHEGGIATPLVVHWPQGITARGELRTQTGHIIDLMPTLLEVTGAKYPTEVNGKDIRPMEGQSLVPAFGKAKAAPRRLFWEHEGNAAAREGEWKLVRSGAKGKWELYHLANDPTELDNLAAKHPERVKDLSAAWKEWARRVGAKPFHKLSSNTNKVPTAPGESASVFAFHWQRV